MTTELSKKSVGGSWRNIWREIIMDWDRTQMLISFALIGLLAFSPVVVKSPYYMGIIILTTIYAIMGITWNIVAGFTGQLLIAHITFLAFGAYTTIVLNNLYGVTPWIGILAGGLVSAVAGSIVAFITLRYGLKMDYFALFTIALMVALKTLFLKWKLVGGAVGMWIRLTDPSLRSMVFSNKPPYLYIALGLLVIFMIIQFRIYRSKMGKYFIAIREDEQAAAALGVNTSKYKMLAVIIGTGMAGIAGGFYIMYVTYIEPPQVFNLGLNVEIVMASPIIGGLGTLSGPLLGALLNKPLAELIRGILSAERSGSSLIVYGSFLIGSVLFMPRGLAGVVENAYLRLRQRLIGNHNGGDQL